MTQKRYHFPLSRTALSAAAVIIVFLALVFIHNMGDKQLRFLKADNVTSITITDHAANREHQCSAREDIRFLIDAFKDVTSYANIRTKDVFGSQLVFTIHYTDGRTRNIILADPSRGSESEPDDSGTFCNASLQINNRWYKTNSETVELLYHAYQKMS